MVDESYCFQIWLNAVTHEVDLVPIDGVKPLSVHVFPYEASLIFSSLTLEGLDEPCHISPSGVPRLCTHCLAAVMAASWTYISEARLANSTASPGART